VASTSQKRLILLVASLHNTREPRLREENCRVCSWVTLVLLQGLVREPELPKSTILLSQTHHEFGNSSIFLSHGLILASEWHS